MKVESDGTRLEVTPLEHRGEMARQNVALRNRVTGLFTVAFASKDDQDISRGGGLLAYSSFGPNCESIGFPCIIVDILAVLQRQVARRSGRVRLITRVSVSLVIKR